MYKHTATITFDAFPLDMLRYDQCFPAAAEDTSRLVGVACGFRTINVEQFTKTKRHEFTPDRWKSFGASIKVIRTVKVD